MRFPKLAGTQATGAQGHRDWKLQKVGTGPREKCGATRWGRWDR